MHYLMQLTQHYILICTRSSNNTVKEQILTDHHHRQSVIPSAVKGKNPTIGFHLACITKGLPHYLSGEITMWSKPWPVWLVIKPKCFVLVLSEMCRTDHRHWVPGQICGLMISDYNVDVHSWLWNQYVWHNNPLVSFSEALTHISVLNEMAQVSSHDLSVEQNSCSAAGV